MSKSNNQPLSLKRIHLFLRQLNSTTSGLLASLAAAPIIPTPINTTTNHVTGNRKNQAELDIDYQNNNKLKGKGKVKAKRSATIEPAGVEGDSFDGFPVASSSAPTRVTYASRKMDSISTSTTTSATNAIQPTCRSTLTPLQLNKHFMKSGMDHTTAVKAVQLYRAFANILEYCYPLPSPITSAKSANSAIERLDLLGPTPTLVESMSRKIGWGINEAVIACIAYANDVRDKAEGFEQDEDEEERSGRRRQRSRIDEEDENLLIEEWYESCPMYAWKFVLAQHATSIIISELGTSLPSLTHMLLEVCLSHNATFEAARFYGPLISSGFTSSPSCFALHRTSHSLALSLDNRTSSIYLDELEQHLLSSSFSARLFFSPYLSLGRLPSYNDLEVIQGELGVVLRAGRLMMGVIGEEGEGGSRLSQEVVERLNDEVGFVLDDLLKHQRSPMIANQLAERREAELIQALMDIVEEFSPSASSRGESGVDSMEILRAMTMGLLLARTADGYDESNAMRRLFNISVSTSTVSPSNVANSLLSYSTTLLLTTRIRPDLHRHLVGSLRSTNLIYLESQLIASIIDIHSTDIKAQKVMGRKIIVEELEMRKINKEWGDRLMEAERRCMAFEAPKGGVMSLKSRLGWRYDDMIGGHVTITPARSTVPPSKPRRSLLTSSSTSTPLRTSSAATSSSTPLHHHLLPASLRRALPPRTIERLTLFSVSSSPLHNSTPLFIRPIVPIISSPVDTSFASLSEATSSFNSSIRLTDLSNLINSSSPSSSIVVIPSSEAVMPFASSSPAKVKKYSRILPLGLVENRESSKGRPKRRSLDNVVVRKRRKEPIKVIKEVVDVQSANESESEDELMLF